MSVAMSLANKMCDAIIMWLGVSMPPGKKEFKECPSYYHVPVQLYNAMPLAKKHCATPGAITWLWPRHKGYQRCIKGASFGF